MQGHDTQLSGGWQGHVKNDTVNLCKWSHQPNWLEETKLLRPRKGFYKGELPPRHPVA